MNHRSLFLNLTYLGRVRSLRRDYHVLEGSDHYVLLSPSAAAGGNYSVVTKATVAYLLKRVGGKRSVTSADVWAACKRSKLLSDRFSVLHALYVLVAIRAATIVKYGSPLRFNVRKRAV
ncbi:MAG: hypothetical protein WAU32_04165 [Thermoanaerobaculia bacterium]